MTEKEREEIEDVVRDIIKDAVYDAGYEMEMSEHKVAPLDQQKILNKILAEFQTLD